MSRSEATRPLQILLQHLRRKGLPQGARFALTWHGASVLIGFVVAAILILAQPFDLDQGIGDRGREAFYKVASFAYPIARSRKVVVVLVDEHSLHDQEVFWPAPYGFHADALDAIHSRHPRAIFVDFTFQESRPDPTLPALVREIRHIAADTPIYLAVGPIGKHAPPARPEIWALRTLHNVRFVSILRPEHVASGATYYMSTPRAEHVARYDLQPAARAMYLDLCEQAGTCHLRGEEDMEIWWAVNRHGFNCRSLPKYCSHLPSGPVARFFSYVWAVFGFRPVDPITLPYAPTVTLLDINNGADDEGLQDLMNGSVVFYGGQMVNAGDIVESPVHGPLAGVQAHAMAFDNLAALDGAYIQARPPWSLDYKAHLVVLCGVLALLSLMVRWYLTLRRPGLRLQPQHRTEVFGSFDALTFFLGAVAIAMIEFNIGRVGPTAWAPVLAATAAGDFLSRRPLTARLLIAAMGRKRTAHGDTAKKRRREQ